MRLDPSLQVNRLLIERDSHTAYDETFHPGLNIIRGENSSGKSTILNFLFYALGGELSDWSETALLCTRVTLEASLNGNVATLSRPVSDLPNQHMDIFGGPLEEALKAPRSEWSRYSYRRAQSKESFSQALFRLLKMPEVGNDVSGNITMHQVLRLLYADQLSPVEHIFKFEPFDPPTLREAIGRLVCGAYDNTLYENELRIRELDKQFNAVSAELRSLLAVLGRAGEAMTLEWIAAQRRVLEDRRSALRTEVEETERQLYSAQSGDELTLKAQQRVYAEVQSLQQELGRLEEKRDSIALAMSDSAAFISGLEQKLEALNDSGSVADYVGEIRFQTCPSCLAPLQNGADHKTCHLCKTPFDGERAKSRIVSLINDTALQLRQSRSLQTQRTANAAEVEARMAAMEEAWRASSVRLNDARKLPSTELQDSLRELHRQSGYLDREIEDLEKKAAIVQLVDQLSSKKSEIASEITRLKVDNEARKAEQAKRVSTAYTAISNEVRDLLHKDLRRQDSFEKAAAIQFDFGANSITVDGKSYFSASSRAILKTSFFVGLLAAATKNSFFRHPRFCIVDTIEDKGMEPIRSQNFQRLIAQLSASTPAQHQIIIATAMIAPDLDEPKYTVGKASTRDDRALKIA